jgi:threonyl-tRNA synthetase
MAAEAANKMAALSVADGKTPEQLVAEKKPYYEKRIQLFEQFWARQQASVEAAKKENVQISVVLPDGKTKHGLKGVTTPFDIAKEISTSLAKKVVVADVDGSAWDLMRPLEGDCTLKLFSFEDAEGKDVSVRLPLCGIKGIGRCHAKAALEVQCT